MCWRRAFIQALAWTLGLCAASSGARLPRSLLSEAAPNRGRRATCCHALWGQGRGISGISIGFEAPFAAYDPWAASLTALGRSNALYKCAAGRKVAPSASASESQKARTNTDGQYQCSINYWAGLGTWGLVARVGVVVSHKFAPCRMGSVGSGAARALRL